jgi:hypothetical protein
MPRKRAKKFEREKDRIDELEKQVRELKSINRSLLKQLKKLTRSKHEFENILTEEDEIKLEPVEKCTECGKGNIITVDIVGRVFQRCDVCDWRSRSRKK